MGVSAAVAVGAVVVGSAMERDANNKAADAAGRAALDRETKTYFAYDDYKQESAKALNPYMEKTNAELVRLDDVIARQDSNIARQEKLIGELDPTVIEASQQALKLLRGEEAQSVAPLRRQRDTQRMKLLQTLREQLGPGAETSTAGIQALTRFDTETANLLSGAQTTYLGQLGQTGAQFSSMKPDLMREIMGSAQIGQAKTNLLGDQANFGFRRAEGIYNANMPMIGSAGAGEVGNMMKAQSNAAFGGQIAGMGSAVLGAYAGNYAGAAGKAAGAKAGGGGTTTPPVE